MLPSEKSATRSRAHCDDPQGLTLAIATSLLFEILDHAGRRLRELALERELLRAFRVPEDQPLNSATDQTTLVDRVGRPGHSSFQVDELGHGPVGAGSPDDRRRRRRWFRIARVSPWCERAIWIRITLVWPEDLAQLA